MTVLPVVFALAFQAASSMKPGVERWPVKTSLAAHATKGRAIPFADLIALPDASGVTKDDKRYQSVRIPSESGAAHKEGELLTAKGYLHLVALESDGDFHIQISDSPTSGDNCLIIEVPNPDKAYVSDVSLFAPFESVRNFITTKLLKGKNPSSGGSVMQHTVYVTFTGALFYDDSHVGTPPRGKKGMHAATLWELHPVTAMAFAPLPSTGNGK